MNKTNKLLILDLSGLLPPEHKQLSQELMRIPAVTAVVVVIELDGHIELPTPVSWGNYSPVAWMVRA